MALPGLYYCEINGSQLKQMCEIEANSFDNAIHFSGGLKSQTGVGGGGGDGGENYSTNR